MAAATKRKMLAPVNTRVEPQEMHCAGCGRFLGYQAILLGIVKIKCPNCKEWNTIDIWPEDDTGS